MVRNPAGVSGWPRCGPLATTNNTLTSVSGRSASRYVCTQPATSLSIGVLRSRPPLPVTRAQPRAMSTLPIVSAKTSALRSPENSIRPAIALSRQVRSLARKTVTSAPSRPRGSGRGCRTRKAERGCGRARCPSRPSRWEALTRRPAGPRGIGLVASGSRITRKPNRTLTAASRRLTVAGANPWQEARNRSNAAESTRSIGSSCSRSQRQNASRSNA